MSVAFTEELSQDEWTEVGGGGAAERGLYNQVIAYVIETGKRFHQIPMSRGPFAGKKASSVSTALKNARDAKTAPEGAVAIKITSRGENKEKNVEGMVFIENTAVEV